MPGMNKIVDFLFGTTDKKKKKAPKGSTKNVRKGEKSSKALDKKGTPKSAVKKHKDNLQKRAMEKIMKRGLGGALSDATSSSRRTKKKKKSTKKR